jgi:hypothetical protein
VERGVCTIEPLLEFLWRDDNLRTLHGVWNSGYSVISPLFFNDLHNLIRKRLNLPYLTGSFHPSFIEEYAGGLLLALQKQDGGIRPSSAERSGVAVSQV